VATLFLPLADANPPIPVATAAASCLVARCYQNGVTLKTDTSLAYQYYMRAYEICQHPKAMNGIGICYERGSGVKKNMATASSWYAKAAEAGSSLAQSNLAIQYMFSGKAKEGLELLQRAVDQNHPRALYTLGCYYTNGQFVKQDREKGFELLLRCFAYPDPTYKYHEKALAMLKTKYSITEDQAQKQLADCNFGVPNPVAKKKEVDDDNDNDSLDDLFPS
jgi:TPR repeat protein